LLGVGVHWRENRDHGTPGYLNPTAMQVENRFLSLWRHTLMEVQWKSEIGVPGSVLPDGRARDGLASSRHFPR
jgi:hypothetical protein